MMYKAVGGRHDGRWININVRPGDAPPRTWQLTYFPLVSLREMSMLRPESMANTIHIEYDLYIREEWHVGDGLVGYFYRSEHLTTVGAIMHLLDNHGGPNDR